MSRKLEILATALILFNENNTQTATTNHIAKAMGISPGNLHYHYKNREEIIRKLYIQMREKMSLSISELPNTLKELHEHEKLLMKIQWEYRFFFKEILFLFSRDSELEKMYIVDNINHRVRIQKVMENLIIHGEMREMDEESLNYLVDSILLSWQFYSSYMQTLGKKLDQFHTAEVIAYTTRAMKPFLLNREE